MQANAILLNNNSLTGTIPATWDRMIELQQLNLASNKLSGPVPAGIIMPQPDPEDAEPLGLAFLDVSNNNFSGTLPVQAFQLPNLTYIDLSYNAFVGSLPQDLPANLAVLNLTANKLESGLPSAWGKSSSMAVLRLDDNALAGTLPEQWADLGQPRGIHCSLHSTTVHCMAQCQKVGLNSSACTSQGPLHHRCCSNHLRSRYRQQWATLSSQQDRQWFWTPSTHLSTSR